MNVILTTPISITVSSAQLVVEDSGTGTIEFALLGQPVRLNILSTDYTFDINIEINDRVQLIQNFGALNTGSRGVVKQIIPSTSQDTALVLFDQIYPDQTFNYPFEADVQTTVVSLQVQVPLNIIQRV
jgi:hypothetical protein